MSQLNEIERIVINKFEKYIYEKRPSNDLLVQIIELGYAYLNAESIQECANRLSKSYNGILKTKQITTIRNQKYITDNS